MGDVKSKVRFPLCSISLCWLDGLRSRIRHPTRLLDKLAIVWPGLTAVSASEPLRALGYGPVRYTIRSDLELKISTR